MIVEKDNVIKDCKRESSEREKGYVVEIGVFNARLL